MAGENNKAALIVVDFQEDFCPPVSRGGKLISLPKHH